MYRWSIEHEHGTAEHSAHFIFSQNILDLNVLPFIFYPLSVHLNRYIFSCCFSFRFDGCFSVCLQFHPFEVVLCIYIKRFERVCFRFEYNDTVFVIITEVICCFHRFRFVAHCKWCTSTNRILVFSAHESLSQISVHFVFCTVFVYYTIKYK